MAPQKKTRLSATEIAEYLELPVLAIYRLVKTGQIPHIRFGQKKLFFDRAEIDAWLEERTFRPASKFGGTKERYDSWTPPQWSAFLDERAADYGLVRSTGARARRYVTFCRNRAVAATVIPKDTIVQTEVDANGVRYRFYTTAAVTLETGETSVVVEIEAENVGDAYNFLTGVGEPFGLRDDIEMSLPKPVFGIDCVRDDLMPVPRIASEGADPEDDECLRGRIVEAFSGTVGDRFCYYSSLAMEDIRVEDVRVDRDEPRGSGSIDLTIESITESPSRALLIDINDRINGTEANDYKGGARLADDDVAVYGFTRRVRKKD